MDTVKENPKFILEVIKNLHKALEIGQKNGSYTLQQAFSTYENLQTLNDYIKISLPLIQKRQAGSGGFMNLIPGSDGLINIPKMSREESVASAAQEKGIILNADENKIRELTEEEKEQERIDSKKLKNIEEIENLIAAEVETSDEEEVVEIEEEEKIVGEEVVEIEEEEKIVGEEVVQKSINERFSREARQQKDLANRKQIFTDYYSDDSEELETISI